MGVSYALRKKLHEVDVPCTMQVICHDIKPVDDLHQVYNVKILHIPIAGRNP